MKKLSLVLSLLVIVLMLSNVCNAKPMPQKAKEDSVVVLVLLGEWFGDTYFPLKKTIESFGWKMYRTGVDTTYRGCYNKARDVELTTEIFIQDIKDFSKYDCLIIPSGPQFRKFRAHKEIYQFLRDAHKAGLLIASFCVGNNVVSEAGLIDFIPYSRLFPEKVTLVKEGIILGPRGGGPPPGDGYESAPIDEICRAVAKELGVEVKIK